MKHITQVIQERSKREANQRALEHQARKHVERRSWKISSPLGQSIVHEAIGPWDGPTLFVVGGHHGDEPAGHIAAGILARSAYCTTGRLIVLPNANPSAIAVFSRYAQTNGETDLNRCYQIPDHRRDACCAGAVHASAILATVLAMNPTIIVDLHETSHLIPEGKAAAAAGKAIWCFADSQLDREIALEAGLEVAPGVPIPTAFTSVTSSMGICSIATETLDSLPLAERVRGHIAAVLTLGAMAGLDLHLKTNDLLSMR